MLRQVLSAVQYRRLISQSAEGAQKPDRVQTLSASFLASSVPGPSQASRTKKRKRDWGVPGPSQTPCTPRSSSAQDVPGPGSIPSEPDCRKDVVKDVSVTDPALSVPELSSAPGNPGSSLDPSILEPSSALGDPGSNFDPSCVAAPISVQGVSDPCSTQDAPRPSSDACEQGSRPAQGIPGLHAALDVLGPGLALGVSVINPQTEVMELGPAARTNEKTAIAEESMTNEYSCLGAGQEASESTPFSAEVGTTEDSATIANLSTDKTTTTSKGELSTVEKTAVCSELASNGNTPATAEPGNSPTTAKPRTNEKSPTAEQGANEKSATTAKSKNSRVTAKKETNEKSRSKAEPGTSRPRTRRKRSDSQDPGSNCSGPGTRTRSRVQ